MLIGISPLISPELLYVLCSMGHGDEIVLADAHFPGDSINSRVIRADGIRIAPLLAGILPLIALDAEVEAPLIMMAPSANDILDSNVERSYWNEVQKVWPATPAISRIERFSFYDRGRQAYAVVMTGETVTYGNIILKKGVTPF